MNKAKPAKGGIKAGNIGGKKMKKGGLKLKPEENFKRFIFQVMKKQHPKLGISSHCMSTINQMVLFLFSEITGEASQLNRKSSLTSTFTAQDVQSAAKIILPGEFRDHAIS